MFPNPRGIHNPVVLLITSWVTVDVPQFFRSVKWGK